MNERILLVSTCGTSLLTNGADSADRNWLRDHTNKPILEPEDSARLTSLVDKCWEKLKRADEAEQRRMSAELNGISAVCERYKSKQIYNLLVHSDTAIGKATSELVKKVLDRSVELVSVGGLRTDNFESFQGALPDLTKEINQRVEAFREKRYFVVFNLTAGFKSLNGYLQTLGMILADRCVSIFEGENALLEIPRLPVQLAEIDELREHLWVFRRLAMGFVVTAEAATGISETLLIEHNGKVAMSTLGDLVWEKHREALLAEKLHPPLSSKVQISGKVEKQFDKLESKRKVQVNEAIDEFCAHMEGKRPLLKSCTFKKLEGNPVPGMTHELYAWSNGEAGRLFGYYNASNVFVFGELDDHL